MIEERIEHKQKGNHKKSEEQKTKHFMEGGCKLRVVKEKGAKEAQENSPPSKGLSTTGPVAGKRLLLGMRPLMSLHMLHTPKSEKERRSM